MTDGADLSRALRSLVIGQIEALVAALAPGWRLPRVLGGHPVGSDVRADLAFTLGHLGEGGVLEVAGDPVAHAIAEVLRPIDGPGTHTFFSYRVAETVARYGPLEVNQLCTAWSADEVANLAEACDSTSWLPLLDDPALPANYAAVLARCELARERLGLPTDPTVVADLLTRTTTLLGSNPLGYLDDDRSNGGRYDIYTLDLYLFCEPFASHLPNWEAGLGHAIELAGHTVADNGAAISWGRSTGLLGLCHTIELAALAVERAVEPSRWLTLASVAVEHLAPWFRDGLTTAHQRRSPYRYRGPARRLQLTLDALGKLAWAANRIDAAGPAVECLRPRSDAFPPVDRWIPFEEDRPLGVWAFRSPHAAFTLPVVGTAWSDYLAAPRQPGRFETPVDRPLAVLGPTVLRGETAHVAAGTPSMVIHHEGCLTVVHDGFATFGGLGNEPGRILDGTRQARVGVDRRTVWVDETLTFAEAPDAVVVQVAEPASQPLVVQVDTGLTSVTSTVDVAGIPEWRSFWGELPTLHQIDDEPAPEMAFRWSVTPVLRVASDAPHHWYHRSLYDPMAPWVTDRAMHRPHWEHPEGDERLRAIDVYHLHWPEWVFDTDVDAARRFVDQLRRCEVRLVWTQHNLLPHREGDFSELYRIIAAAADGVIHHSAWGRERALAERAYRPGALHQVIPHGHWAALGGARDADVRSAVETELGLHPCALRIGVVGAPRPGKDTAGFIDAFARCRRDDLGLLVLSLDADDDPTTTGPATPDDPRIRALPYEFVDRSRWNARLAAIDVLAFPFRPDARMLTTGVFADAIGAGLPALVSGWGFLAEVLGTAGIPMGDTVESWTAALDGLDPDAVAEAAARSLALQDAYDWDRIAADTRTFLEDVAALRP
jgi:hypothetical protein